MTYYFRRQLTAIQKQFRNEDSLQTVYNEHNLKVNQKTEISLHMAFKTAYMQVAYEKCKLFQKTAYRLTIQKTPYRPPGSQKTADRKSERQLTNSKAIHKNS